MRTWGMAVALAVLVGCAGLGKPELVPGQSTAQDVTKQMGKPALELKAPDGGKVEYFTTFPSGRITYAVTLGADGVVRGVDQRLTQDNLQKVGKGMTRQQVLELLGPPRQETPDARTQETILEYPWTTGNGKNRITWVHVTANGAVVDVVEREDFGAEPSE
ncbi:MAG TPA: outer membrane protein assembly factor BamE [Burkholderiales bacterium]|nr:outer membrane protein assembly factor BamE [Burkholderiales bacterium]